MKAIGECAHYFQSYADHMTPSGPVDVSNPTSPASSMTPSTPARKPMLATPLATPTAIPDLDQSMVSLAKEHLTSGGLGNVLSVSGEYRDPSGKIIKR